MNRTIIYHYYFFSSYHYFVHIPLLFCFVLSRSPKFNHNFFPFLPLSHSNLFVLFRCAHLFLGRKFIECKKKSRQIVIICSDRGCARTRIKGTFFIRFSFLRPVPPATSFDAIFKNTANHLFFVSSSKVGN